MIRQIIRKEILENLLSLRFILSLLLVICLFAVSGFVFVAKYKQESQDYWKESNKNLSAFSERSDQLYKLAFYEQQVFRKPKVLSLCAGGFEKSLPNYYEFNMFTTSLPEVKGRGNFTLPHFSDIDWTFIISIILSFVALVFSFNSVCGEREQGTLRLMLAGSIPRHKILTAKYLGVMFTLGIPLLIGLLVNLIIVLSSNVVVIGVLDWLKILVIILLSFLYLSIFILLGLFISSRTARSANSMVLLLLVWVGLVILIPSFGKIISDISYKNPSGVEVERKLGELREQIWTNAEKFGKNAGAYGPNPNAEGLNPPARARLINTLRDGENQILEDHHNKMLAQAFAGRNFTCFSPMVIYQRVSEAIAGTGINHCVKLYQQIKPYVAELKEYIRSKDSEDSDSLHLIFGDEPEVNKWGAVSHKPVDFETVPKFQEKDLGLGESLQLAIWDIGLLALFNLVFFAAAFVSFLKYDVR